MLLIRGDHADEARIIQVLLQFLLILLHPVEILFSFCQRFLDSRNWFTRRNVWCEVYLDHRISWLILQFETLLGFKRW